MAYASIKYIPRVNGVPCTALTTKSGKVRCSTPGCGRVATHIIHVAHIRSWGRPKDLYHCAKHTDGATAVVVSSNAKGYTAEAVIVQNSPMDFEIMCHNYTEVK